MSMSPDECIFRKHFEQSPQGMVVLEPVRAPSSGELLDFRFVDANPSVVLAIGRSVEEIKATPYSRIFPAAFNNGLFEILARTAETGEPFRGKFNYDADGISGWFMLEVIGGSDRIIVTTFDITENRRLSTLADCFFNESPDLHFLTRVDGTIIRANPAAHATLGVSNQQLVGRSVLSLLHPDDGVAFEAWCIERLRSGVDPNLDGNRFRLCHADGTPIWIEWQFHYVNEDGIVFKSARNITERIRAERERYEYEERLRLFVNDAPAAVAMLDTNMRYVLVSQRWLKDYGLEGQNIIGKSHYALFPTVPPRWKEIHRRCLKGERMSCDEDSFLNENGSPQWLRWEIVPWYYENEVGGLVMFTESIDEKKQVEIERVRHQWILEERNQELNAARQEAEAASRAKSAFLANMSHEIRTPMSAILGYAEVLTQQQITSAQRRDAIETIQRNGEHLLALINDVLDLSKIEAGHVRVEAKAVDPARLCEDVAKTLRVRAEANYIQLNVRIDESVPKLVETDPLRVRQVLVNLLSNAIKFTSVGGNITLSVSAEPPLNPLERDATPTLRFDVIDDGIGISEQEANNLFQPFVQADASTTRRFGGTGLGLALSRELARTLGGNLWLEHSAPSEGSHFAFQVPLIAASDAEADQSPASVASCEQAQSFVGQPRILLVEDGVDNQRLFQFHLQAAGAVVTIAQNGQAALDLYDHGSDCPDTRFPFDLVLMDMQMPVMDGYQATESLRLLGLEIPILALTAHAMAEDRKRCIDIGCDDFLTKPITRDALLMACQRWLTKERRNAAA